MCQEKIEIEFDLHHCLWLASPSYTSNGLLILDREASITSREGIDSDFINYCLRNVTT